MTNIRKAEIYGRLQAVVDLIDAVAHELKYNDEVENEIKIDLNNFSNYTLGPTLNEFYGDLENLKEERTDQTQ